MSRHEFLIAKMKAHQEEDARRLCLIGFDWRASPRREHGQTTGNPIKSPASLQVTLSAGWEAVMTQMFQYPVYAGVLAGIPTSPASMLIQAIEEVERLFPDHAAPPFVLEPIFDTGTVTAARGGEIPWIMLPPVCTIARLDSNTPVRDNTHKDGSTVIAVWFQNEFGLVRDQYTLKQLRQLDWVRFAKNWGM